MSAPAESAGSKDPRVEHGEGVHADDAFVAQYPLRLLFHVGRAIEVERFRELHGILPGFDKFPILWDAADT